VLHNADAFDVFPTLDDNSIDALITDPPYGTTDHKWDEPFDLDLFWEHTKRVMKPDGVVAVFCDQPFTSLLVVSNIRQFRYEWVWDRGRVSTAFHARKRPMKTTEDIVVFSEQTPRYFIDDLLEDANPNIVIKRKKYRHATGTNEERDGGIYTPSKTNYPKETLHYAPVRAKSRHDNTKHPTQKPEDLMEFLVSIYTQEGDVVLDPFMGSGTTGVACKKLNRKFVGVEQDPHYFALAGGRLAS
jgi:site-specific DNA-methyltransferase (adenine-specific)